MDYCSVANGDDCCKNKWRYKTIPYASLQKLLSRGFNYVDVGSPHVFCGPCRNFFRNSLSSKRVKTSEQYAAENMTRTSQKHSASLLKIAVSNKKDNECFHTELDENCNTCQCKVLISNAGTIKRKSIEEICTRTFKKRAKESQIVIKNILNVGTRTQVSFSRKKVQDDDEKDVLFQLTSKHAFGDYMDQSLKFNSRLQITNDQYSCMRGIASTQKYVMSDHRTVASAVRKNMNTKLLVKKGIKRNNCNFEESFPFVKGEIDQCKLLSSAELNLPKVIEKWIEVTSSRGEILVLTPSAQENLYDYIKKSPDSAVLKGFRKDSPTLFLNRADDGMGVYNTNVPVVRGAFTVLNNPKRLNDPDSCIVGYMWLGVAESHAAYKSILGTTWGYPHSKNSFSNSRNSETAHGNDSQLRMLMKMGTDGSLVGDVHYNQMHMYCGDLPATTKILGRASNSHNSGMHCCKMPSKDRNRNTGVYENRSVMEMTTNGQLCCTELLQYYEKSDGRPFTKNEKDKAVNRACGNIEPPLIPFLHADFVFYDVLHGNECISKVQLKVMMMENNHQNLQRSYLSHMKKNTRTKSIFVKIEAVATSGLNNGTYDILNLKKNQKSVYDTVYKRAAKDKPMALRLEGNMVKKREGNELKLVAQMLQDVLADASGGSSEQRIESFFISYRNCIMLFVLQERISTILRNIFPSNTDIDDLEKYIQVFISYLENTSDTIWLNGQYVHLLKIHVVPQMRFLKKHFGFGLAAVQTNISEGSNIDIKKRVQKSNNSSERCHFVLEGRVISFLKFTDLSLDIQKSCCKCCGSTTHAMHDAKCQESNMALWSTFLPLYDMMDDDFDKKVLKQYFDDADAVSRKSNHEKYLETGLWCTVPDFFKLKENS